jgi:hypothetical protein
VCPPPAAQLRLHGAWTQPERELEEPGRTARVIAEPVKSCLHRSILLERYPDLTKLRGDSESRLATYTPFVLATQLLWNAVLGLTLAAPDWLVRLLGELDLATFQVTVVTVLVSLKPLAGIFIMCDRRYGGGDGGNRAGSK